MSQPAVPLTRKRGRPRVPEPRSSVSAWLPARVHDRLIAVAHRQDVSVSALVRKLIIFTLDDRSGPR